MAKSAFTTSEVPIKHVAEFRDSAAHRIPLYVPPYVIADKDARKYELLGQKASAVYQRRDKAAYDRLRLEQQALGKYRPWMSHSPTERSPTCVFHRQILRDFVTIDEIAEKLFQEIAIFEPAAQTNRFSIKAIFGWLISRIFH